MTIVCLGDSITCNWDSPTYTNYWQELLDQKSGTGSYQIINAGVNGETAQDGYSRLEHDVLHHTPDLVTVMFGHNEVWQNIPAERYGVSLRLIVEAIHHHNKQTKIWLLTPNKAGDKSFWKKYIPYVTAIKKVSDEKGITLIDVHKAYDDEDLGGIYTYEVNNIDFKGKDFIHPNEKGQRLIAEYLTRNFYDLSNANSLLVDLPH